MESRDERVGGVWCFPSDTITVFHITYTIHRHVHTQVQSHELSNMSACSSSLAFAESQSEFTESVRLNTEALSFWEETGDGWAGWRTTLQTQPALCPSAAVNGPVTSLNKCYFIHRNIHYCMTFEYESFKYGCRWLFPLAFFTTNRLFNLWTDTMIVKTSQHRFPEPEAPRRKAANPFHAFMLF